MEGGWRLVGIDGAYFCGKGEQGAMFSWELDQICS